MLDAQPLDLDDDELEGVRILEWNLSKLNDIADRHNRVAVTPGGMLEREDEATRRDPFSYQIHHLVQSALEPLETLARLLAEGLPMLSGYTLIRASIEASALGLWLLNGGTMDKRIFRSLQLTLDGKRDVESFMKSIGVEQSSTTADLLVSLTELKDARKSLRQKSLDRPFPSMTDVLIEVSRKHTARTMRPLDIWKACSGIAHSNKAMNLVVLESRLLTTTANGGEYHMTSSFLRTASFFTVARELLESLIASYEAHASVA